MLPPCCFPSSRSDNADFRAPTSSSTPAPGRATREVREETLTALLSSLLLLSGGDRRKSRQRPRLRLPFWRELSWSRGSRARLRGGQGDRDRGDPLPVGRAKRGKRRRRRLGGGGSEASPRRSVRSREAATAFVSTVRPFLLCRRRTSGAGESLSRARSARAAASAPSGVASAAPLAAPRTRRASGAEGTARGRARRRAGPRRRRRRRRRASGDPPSGFVPPPKERSQDDARRSAS